VDVQGSIDDDSEVTLRLKVTNSGAHPGREVVQVYVSAPSSSTVERPAKSLEGFAKTALLKAGESEEVSITLPRRSFAFWSTKKNAWIVEQGTYSLQVAKSSADVVTTADFTVNTQQQWVGLWRAEEIPDIRFVL
jgi:beta-glucosidase